LCNGIKIFKIGFKYSLFVKVTRQETAKGPFQLSNQAAIVLLLPV